MKTKDSIFVAVFALLLLCFGPLSCSKDPVSPPSSPKLSWKTVSSPTAESYRDAWGSSADSVFAVGDNGIIALFNGTNWTLMTSGTLSDLTGVWGTSGTDVYVVGDVGAQSPNPLGTTLRFDGSAWQAMTNYNQSALNGVWGFASDDIYAVGDDPLWGTVRHFTGGSNWSSSPSIATRALNGIWGDSPSSVFAVGDDASTFHFDGAGWTHSPNGITWVLPFEDGRGIRYQEGSPSLDPPALLTFFAIKKTSFEDRVVMEFPLDQISGTLGMATLDLPIRNIDEGGTAGIVNVYQYSNPPNLPYEPIGADGEIVSDEFWGGSYFTQFLSNVSRLNMHVDALAPVQSAVTAARSHIGFRLSTTSTDRYDMGSMASLPNPTMTVSMEPSPPALNAVWGSSANNVYAVGEVGAILHFDGSSWSPMNSGVLVALNDVWGASASEVFVVGNDGTILKLSGSSWRAMSGGTAEDLFAVWGSSASNVYTFGANGTILRYGP